MKYKCLLFDLDGTLTDSGEGIINSVVYSLEKLGLPVPPMSELRKFVGPPLKDSYARVGVPEDKIDEAIINYRVRYDTQGGKFENLVYDGIEELLERLKADGFRLFVATSKPEPLAREVLEHFNLTHWFEEIAGASMDGVRLTKAQVIQYLLDQIGELDDALMIGDTEYDVIGARNLGIPCVGVTWGYGLRESLERECAVHIVDTPMELYNWLT